MRNDVGCGCLLSLHAVFDALAAHALDRPLHEAVLNLQGDERVLDIGAGPGTYFREIAPRIPNGLLVSGDLSLGMARRATQQGKADLLTNSDTQALPFRDVGEARQ